MSRKIALITGGSRGLGRSMAINLAKSGVDIILTYHNRKDDADTVVAEIKTMGGMAAALQLDTGDTAFFNEFSEQLRTVLQNSWNRQHIDFLVNNAGIGIHKSFAETTEDDFDLLCNIHLRGVFFLTQKLLPLIQDGGKILNLSTGLARFCLPGYAAYGSIKGGVETLTRYMAKELAPRGISVNTIAPGATETDFSGGVVRDNVELNKLISSTVAMGRVGLPEDIGSAVASLLAGQNQWVTGQRIEISGGQNL